MDMLFILGKMEGSIIKIDHFIFYVYRTMVIYSTISEQYLGYLTLII